MDEKAIRRIKNVLTVAEQGVQTIPYGKVEVMADGPGGKRQITLSIGFTQFGSNLSKVMRAYADHPNAKYADEICPYIARLKDSGTANDSKLKDLLRRAGDEDPVMGKIQEDKFTELYLGPAMKWAGVEGFIEPFSCLIICDSFLHSGSILSSIRSRFAELTPAHGGDEKRWITDYLNARDDWLKSHSNPLVRTSSYRTKYYKELLALEDWQLDMTHTIAMNGVKPLAV
jgi:chitosanase